jgi:hypothetical protein
VCTWLRQRKELLLYQEEARGPAHPPEHEHRILLGMVSDNRSIKKLYHPNHDFKILESNFAFILAK